VPDNILRFNPIQIGEWLGDLAERNFSSQDRLADYVGLSRTRVEQFLYLLRIPADLRARLKVMAGLTEGELRPLTKMDARRQTAAVGRLLGVAAVRKAG
jgi:hypothetical protein